MRGPGAGRPREGDRAMRASSATAPTCPTGGWSARPSPRRSAPPAARAPAPSPPTTRTRPRSAWRRPGGAARRAGRRAAGALLRHRRPRLPRQDQRHGRSTPRSACRRRPSRVRHRRLGALGGRRAARGARRAGDRRWPCCQRHPHRSAGRRRRARRRRRRGGVRVRRRRRRCAACWPSCSAGASATAEFLDRWRLPGDAASRAVGGALRRARLRAARRGGADATRSSRPA